MCTPEHLRENCSCPHLALSNALAAARIAAVLAVAAGIWWLASGHWLVLALMGWVVLMAAGWRLSRREWLLVHRYTPQREAVREAPVAPRVVWADRDRLPQVKTPGRDRPGAGR